MTPEATYEATGDSKFMLAMLFGAAAKYTDDLSAAVKRGNRAVVAKGKIPGPAPLGYIKTHEHELTPGSGTVIPDPERFEAVKRIWQTVLGGETNVSEIWRLVRYEWGLTTRPTKNALARPIALTNVYAILRNPFYAGEISRGGETAKGEHPPMVTLDDFKQVQKLLERDQRGGQHHQTHSFLYQGLLHCGECERLLTGESHISTNGIAHIYYRCGRRRSGYLQCHAQEVTETEVDEALAELFDRVIVDPQIQEWAFEAIAWWRDDNETSPEKLVRRAKAVLARAENGLATLTDMVISGLITQEEYKVRRINQLAKIEHLREALANPIEKLAAWTSARDRIRESHLGLGEEFRKGDNSIKQKIITRTCSRILIKAKKPLIELRTPFLLHLPQPHLQSSLPIIESVCDEKT